ncbi:MAG: protein-glutamate O-methyltransferase CheR [Magnetococcales bacterium]|nr:protein-glutamate O-methyltransferase CheR [Magnetococcales bacterium]MBF0157684.1 protein-glutamate O-methyltransferase CheR [Magnetococcales bacterium]
MESEEIQEIEVRLLLDALYLRYGYDFRNYDRTLLKRRLLSCLEACTFNTIAEIIPHLLHQGSFLPRLVHALSVNTTAMFRDPAVFAAIRESLLPVLATYPFINIWHAGCATGEEVYSLAILLAEAGLLDHARLYATDIDEEVLAKAREGVYAADHLTQFAANYRAAGGCRELGDYVTQAYGLVRMAERLRENIVFANHNLVTDGVFAEIHLLMCRNVLIYFDPGLQKRAVGLFRDSLVRGGFLCLGHTESLLFSGHADHFREFSRRHRIYRKRTPSEPSS